jgi:hypothetical protein
MIRDHLMIRQKISDGRDWMSAFMLKHGVEYRFGPGSFTGPRAEQGACFKNATLLMLRERHLTYAEGVVGVYGIPIDHAWCVDPDGLVIDPTLDAAISGGGMERITGYFGVPFRREYVERAIIANGFYGLLDGWHARKTLPKLVELGLADGQAWLLSGARKLGAGVAALLCAAALLGAPEAQAQSRVVYGPDGRPVAQIHSDYARGTATEYDAKTGRVTGRATTGSDGTITVYGSDGRVREHIAPGSGRKP